MKKVYWYNTTLKDDVSTTVASQQHDIHLPNLDKGC